MPRLTIQDVKRIKEEARQRMTLRSGEARAKVTVHMGTCGISAGAREVLSALLKAIEEQHTPDVLVTTSGCAGLCSREPMATVEVKEQPPVKYVDLNPERMVQIFLQHVLGGRVVGEYALAAGSETTG